ncbi:unnamed protein product [Allacma fusca]|uniref:tRNA-specific adenosine deaminase 1 n=1 Tax=Allacma fusca TaxID=39272 RepID=A0A8J2NXT3_9HEXA|nr:unnamed protein product [Allacma fusca]
MTQPSLKTPFLEKIAEHVCKHFKSLPKQGKPSPEKNEWTTMASIVQSEGEDNVKIIALGTGTRCLGHNELSDNGDVLSDSHAEIIARRSFLLYLHDQLSLAISNKHSILVRNSCSPQLFDLIPSIKFHLFVSHVPCGDAAIFEIIDTATVPIIDGSAVPPTKKVKLETSQHRTGAKLKVGDIYEEVQTPGKCRVKPGKGDPTLSMSCSDKIAKWQILGMQGSLLGNFIKTPLVLSSVIIGGKVNLSASTLQRALFHRFHDSLIDAIKVNHTCPDIYQSHINFMEFPADGCPAPGAISGYLKSCSKFITEVTVNGRKQGVTKKNFGKPSSRSSICRKNLYQLFLKTESLLHETSQGYIPSHEAKSYADAKTRNGDYFTSWNNLKQSHAWEGWTCKPEVLSLFSAQDN